MINLRYHIVSIVAVFLALALGLALGAAFIDRATVETLRNRQNSLEERLDQTDGENDLLRQQLELLGRTDEELTGSGGAWMLPGQLEDVPVLVVANRGVDDDLVDGVRSTLRQAGADDRGTLWLEPSLSLEDGDDVDRLAGALDTPAIGLREGRRALANRLARWFLATGQDVESDTVPPVDPPGPPEVTATTTGGEGSQGSDPALEQARREAELAVEQSQVVLCRLVNAGLVEIEGRPVDCDGGGSTVLAPGGMRFVFLSTQEADLEPGVVMDPVLRRMTADEPAPVVAASAPIGAFDDPDRESTRLAFVGLLREEESYDGRLSTVDHADHAAGRLALVLAVDELADGRYGDYGEGGELPALPSPPPISG